MSVTNQAVRVTSEASDGQSAMEMVILYCVSLEGTERALVWRFPSSGVSGSSVLAGQTSPAGFAALLGLMGQKDPSTCTAQIRLRYSLARFFTGVNADLTLLYAGS